MSSQLCDDTRWSGAPQTGFHLQDQGWGVGGALTAWFEKAKGHIDAALGRANGHRGCARAAGTSAAELAWREEVRLVQRVFMTHARARRVVLFAGVEQDNGCARVSVRVGQTLARLQPQTVCVVNANLRTRVRHRATGSDDQDGFAGAVAHSGFLSTSPKRVTPGNLWLLPAGAASAEPDLLFTTDRLLPRVKELSAMFDHVVLYGPPVNLYAESLALSQCVDGVVLVLEAHVTRREIARGAKMRLEELGVPVLGVVLNNRTYPIPDAIYRLL